LPSGHVPSYTTYGSSEYVKESKDLEGLKKLNCTQNLGHKIVGAVFMSIVFFVYFLI